MKKPLKTGAACGVLLGGVFALFACGDDVTKVYRTTGEDFGLDVVESSFALGTCDSASVGKMMLAQGENAVYLCADTGWTLLSGDKSCAMEPLSDSTGHRIVCGGDSVGIVLNGSNGEDGTGGTDGKNGTYCTEKLLSDSSGYKILCGGDSVGVILNGVDGKDGNDGKNGSNGTSCSVTALSDGSGYRIVCDGDSVGVVLNGSDGKTSSSAGSSSSSVKSSSSSGAIESSSSVEKYTNPKISYGTLLDPRDMQTKYRTVVIGTQTWMAENLNYDTTASYCYNNEPANCAIYGRLYTWEVANKVCPPAWHLPNSTEWAVLRKFVADSLYKGKTDFVGYALKSTSGWSKNRNGSDAFGFGAFPAGRRHYSAGFDEDGDKYFSESAFFWSASKFKTRDNNEAEYDAYAWYVYYNYETLVDQPYNINYAYSVRCVKD